MKQHKKTSPRATPPRHTCERCGSDRAMRIGDHWLCEECYHVRGSCCLEFGGDDLWAEADGMR